MRGGTGRRFRLFFLTIMMMPVLVLACSHFGEAERIRSNFREANDFFKRGNYEASLNRYRQMMENHPAVADRVLFEMGIIYAHPGNENKDYRKAVECFREIVAEYPDSRYRRDSQVMVFQVQNVISKDRIIAAQQSQIERSRQAVKHRAEAIRALKTTIAGLENQVETLESRIAARQERIETLEHQLFILRAQPADKVLIEKKERRLTLLSQGEVIKTYTIALGGNPVGPKEREGDNKTPEGTYIIDARNRHSAYHLSLHISYPNESDKERAKALGVAPGGDIMIHGIKNGFAWVGALHAGIDWTKGCIAVTDKEVEEIFRLVPDGTMVEIRP